MRTLVRIRGELLLLLLLYAVTLQPAVNGAVRRVRIPDKLDDVVDDEEDEEWKAWGTANPKPRPAFDPPPNFVEGMDIGKYQNEMMKRSMGTSMGFVKLRLEKRRDPLSHGIATREVRNIEVSFMAVVREARNRPTRNYTMRGPLQLMH